MDVDDLGWMLLIYFSPFHYLPGLPEVPGAPYTSMD